MFRRKFLQSISTLGMGLTLPLGTVVHAQTAAKPSTQKVKLDLLTIKGRVRAAGKGIAGVVVTDGLNLVQTDSAGKYTLESNATAEFVYITVPRGYAVPHDKGVARFYQPIPTWKSTFTADFDLQKLAQDDTRHNFVVWADPQMINKKDAAELVNVSAPDLKKLVDSYGPSALFHGIGCGDLVWDKFELFQDYQKAIEVAGIPFFQVIGNHDMDLTARTDEGSGQTFKQLFGPTYYSFNRGEVHYVVLDDVFFIGAAKKYIGYLTEKQLQWLEQDLAFVKPGSTVVVSVHIPVNTGHQRRSKLPEEPMGGVVANRKELYRLLEPFKAHIMSGHTHNNEKVQEGNVLEHVHGTVCGAWWTGPVCTDGTPSGYGVYEVNGSELKWYYKSVNHPKEHQMRLYPKGTVKDRPQEVAVNVWNWDPSWKVEWLEDGVRKGAMQQEIGLDPLAVQLQEGPALPAKHKWVEPVLTEHLFWATPSVGAKQITVEVTDRFGQVYREELAV